LRGYFEQIPLNSTNLKGFYDLLFPISFDSLQVCKNLKLKKVKMIIRFLPLLMLPLLGMAQTNSNGEIPVGATTTNEKQALEIKRNVQYNLEEIKVRWKKSALENCPGVPCVEVTVTPPAPSFTCGTSTLTDISGNAYNTVSIGTQCWTKENLKVTRYNDGTLIPNLTNSTSNPWATSGAFTGYVAAGVTNYVGTYGFLYNWYAVTDSRKLCPAGWHVPSSIEWDTLTNYMGGWLVAGDKMKSTGDNVAGTGLWNQTNTGTDFYGFSAHPGGYRYEDGSFYLIKTGAKFWSSTVNSSPSNANTLEIASLFPYAPRDNKSKVSGLSVRCLKDL
jgi:uncharacterized protein (TIGR02145 family)